MVPVVKSCRRLDERDRHAIAGEDLGHLEPSRAAAENGQAARQGACAGRLAIGPRLNPVEAGQIGHCRATADGDDQIASLDLACATALAHLHAHCTRPDDRRLAADHLGAGVLEPLDVAAVVGPVELDAIDHAVAEVGRPGPAIAAASGVHGRRVEQRLRRHACPERARAAEQLAVDDRHRCATPPRLVRGGLAARAGTDDDEVEAQLPAHLVRAEQQRGNQRGARHDRVDLEVLAGRVISAANWAEAVERRHAHPRRRVRVGRAAGRRVAQLEAQPRGDFDRLLGERGSRRLLLHWRPEVSLCRGCRDVGDRVRGRDLADRRFHLRHRLAGRGANVDLELGPLGDDVRPRAAAHDADVDRHSGPAAVERVQRQDLVRGLERSRCGPFPAPLRHARRDRRCRIRKSAIPLRALTMSPFSRADSSTSAIDAPSAQRRMTGRLVGEPISSSGIGDEHQPTERQPFADRCPGRVRARSARSAYSPPSRPPFMSSTPGP